MIGGALIAKGGYGCIFHPSIEKGDKKAKTATLFSFIKLPFVYVNRTHFQ